MRLAMLLGLAGAAAGCAVPAVDCEQVAAQLVACDVRPVALACESLAPIEQYELSQRLQEDGCDALWQGDERRVDEAACDAFGWDCPSAIFRERSELPTRYPVVFVGGIDAREDFDWNPAIADAVEAITGAQTFHVGLPSWTTTPPRAAALQRALEALPTNAKRLNLICYAVGGLDCRYLVSPGGLFADDPQAQAEVAQRIATITTIATPHRGTDAANAALSLATLDGTASLVTALLGPEREAADGLPETELRQTLRGLTNEGALVFNEVVVDASEVSYRSWAGVSHVGGQPLVPTRTAIETHCVSSGGSLAYYRHEGTYDAMTEILWATAPFALRTLAAPGVVVSSPSDGMVSVDSARWGRFGGCVPADHYDVIGQLGDGGLDPNTGFDAIGFYTQLVVGLASEGY